MGAAGGIPKAGEVRRIELPDTFDGIRFEIGRMIDYVQECRNDPLIKSTASKIVDEYLENRRSSDERIAISHLKAIHAWGKERFVEVPCPPGIEIIETPMRLVRRSMIPPEAEAAIYAPFVRDPGSILRLPEPKIATSLISSVSLVLSLVGSLGISSLRIRFGGTDGTLHYAWSSARVYGRWFDLDLLEPFGERRSFEHMEDLEVP
jgi:hypothetical protein